MDEFILPPDDFACAPEPVDPEITGLSDVLTGDATLQGSPDYTAPAWLEHGAAIADCCCVPAVAATATLGLPLLDGSVLELPAEDTTGSGVANRVSLDLNQDGIEDAWGYDQTGSGQVEMLLFDTTGDGVADSVSHMLPTGWSEVVPLDPAPEPAVAPVATAPVVEPAPAVVAPAPAVVAPFVTPAAETDSDGDGRSDAVDAWPYDRYDSASQDRDYDGTADAFDGEPTQPFASATRDEDRDGVNDRFDSEPTQPFASATRDEDRDGVNDRFDSGPTNPYDRD